MKKPLKKRPSVVTVIITGWLGFMFATAVAALIPSVQLLTAPILCSAPYPHGVVEVHNFHYGFTSGYSTELRCANDYAEQRSSPSTLAVVGLLWLIGWAGTLAIRGVYYWGKAAFIAGREAWWRKKLPALPEHSHSAFGTSETSARTPTVAGSRAQSGGRAALDNGRWVPRAADPVDQLAKLADLHDRGALTDSELATEKAKILKDS